MASFITLVFLYLGVVAVLSIVHVIKSNGRDDNHGV